MSTWLHEWSSSSNDTRGDKQAETLDWINLD